MAKCDLSCVETRFFFRILLSRMGFPNASSYVVHRFPNAISKVVPTQHEWFPIVCGDNRKSFMLCEHLQRVSPVCIYAKAAQYASAQYASATFFMFAFAQEPSRMWPVCGQNHKPFTSCEHLQRVSPVCICVRAKYDRALLRRELYGVATFSRID